MSHVEWLPLELFDDKTFDDFPPEEWIVKANKESKFYHALTAKGLYKDDQGEYTWKPIIILDFDIEQGKFKA